MYYFAIVCTGFDFDGQPMYLRRWDAMLFI